MPANIVVPEVGESIVDARVAKWLRKEGDAVSAGDPLVELETDKVDLEVGAPQAGVLSRIDRKDGEDVKVGEVLGVIDEAAQAPARPRTAQPRQLRARRKRRGGASSLRAAAKEKEKTPRSTPTARKAAEQHEVDLAQVRGSGDAGRVMRRDVEQAAPRKRARVEAGTRQAPPPSRRRQSPRPADDRTANAPKSASACRSDARRLPGALSKRRAPQRCSPPSTRWTCRR